jgi:hypothetical protein
MKPPALTFAAVVCLLAHAPFAARAESGAMHAEADSGRADAATRADAGAARAGAAHAESPDPTRLDVERLPPEAIELKRDMFSRGLYLESHLGGRGFVGGLGKLSSPGLLARVDLGFELTSWLMLGGAVELSLHESNAPAPPASSNFQLFDALVQLRLQLPLSVRAMPFIAAEGGVDWSSGTLLAAYGVDRARKIDLTYGGSVGFDWHLLSRHHSLGVLAGARLYPNLTGLGGERTIGIHSAVYLKYVF